MLASVLAVGCADGDVHDALAGSGDGGDSGLQAMAGNSSPTAGTTGAVDAGCAARGPCPDASVRDAGTTTKPDAGTPRDAGMNDAGTNDAGTNDAATGKDSGPQDAGNAAAGDPDATRPGWKLTFRDEFNGAEGGGVDDSKWTPVNKGDGFGNNELEFYTPRSENVRMDGNGSLIIEVRKESYMGRMYTSTRLESSGKFEQRYGRFEIRAKLPFGQGIWPAFWTLGNNISSVSWPECGEIDIMEHVGKLPSTNHGSLHGPGYSGGNPLSAKYELPGGARFADDFHEFAVEWEENVVRWYVDGNLYQTRTPSDVPNGGHWVYDHPFFMILNVAVGGAFPGSPDDTTQFPQRMLVDYVRVYARE